MRGSLRPYVSAVLAVFLVAGSVAAQLSFPASVRYEENSQLEVPRLGDLNEDGVDEIIGVLERTGALRVRLSDTEQRFWRTWWSNYNGATVPIVTDMNDDGHVDVISIGFEDNPCCNARELYFHPGDGTGQTTGRITVPTVIYPHLLAGVDLDGDRFKETVVVDGSNIEVYFGDASGLISPPVTTNLGGFAVRNSLDRLHTGLADLDGHVDLVGLDSTGILFLLGDGAGHFSPFHVPVSSVGPSELAASDVNGDSLLDVAFISTQNELRMLLSDGLGGYSEQGLFTFTSGVRDLEIVDFNGDGFLDVLAAEHQISLFYGDGTGSFVMGPRFAQPDVLELAVGELDGDGVPDLLTTTTRDHSLDISYGKDLLGFGEIPAVLDAGGTSPIAVCGDFNEDGIVDLAWGGVDRWIALGSGGGRFSVPIQIGVSGVRAVEVGDFDGDDHQDLLFVTTDSLEVSFGDGLGGFPESVTTSAVDNEERVLVADIDGDEMTDVFVRQGLIPMVFLSSGRSGFLSQGLDETPLLYEPRYRAAGDLNNDGHVDVILRRRQNDPGGFNRLSVLLGDGTGQFSVIQHMDGGGDQLVLHDFTGDGILDLAVEGNWVRPGLGFGAFDASVLEPDLLGGGDFFFSDINGDGEIDSVSRSGDLRVQLADGEGGFLPAVTIPTAGDQRGDVLAADLDQDGAQDLVLTHSDAGIWLIFNQTRLVESRRGTVDTAVGDPVDVLRVNGQVGLGAGRQLILNSTDPFEVVINRPPSTGSNYVVYAWSEVPAHGTVSDLRFGIGTASMPFVMNNPTGSLRPVVTWNTFVGFDDVLGARTFASGAAPAVLASLPEVGRTGCFFLQGLIADSQSDHGQVAITNGVEVLVR